MKCTLASVIGSLALLLATTAPAAVPQGPARAALYQRIASRRADWQAGKLKQSVPAADVTTLQDWLDLLEDEGCIHPSAITGTPLEMFDSMNAIKQQVSTKSPELPTTVDTLLARLDRLMNIWYADGSVGDIAGPWIPLASATVKSADDHHVVLTAAPQNGSPFDLTITAFENGIFRIHGPVEGFYQPDRLTPAKLDVQQNTDRLTIRAAGSSTFEITLNPLRFRVLDAAGQPIWSEASLSVLLDDATKTVKAVQQSSELTAADRCFGLGERFNALDHRGRVVTNWTSDSIFSSVRSKWTETYKPIPLVIDPRGVSTFYNVQTLARFDLGATDSTRLVATSPGAVFDNYLFIGDPMTALRSYTKLTGEPVAVPDWALTPWMGGGVARWNIHGADKSVEEVRAAVEKMHQLDIPHGAIYIEGLPTDKPEGKALVSWLLNEQHLKPLAWYGPNAATTETDSFTPEQLEHLFVKEPDGKPFVVPPGRFLAGNYYIDFTNPLSVEMLIRRWKWHIDEGIRGCMIDGGEETPRDGVFDNGLHGDVMHNLYPLFYHRAHQSMFEQLIPGDYILFGRSGAPGDQSSLGQFPGDMPGDFSGLTGALYAGLTASSSGFSIWGSDVGGYWSRDGKPPAKDVYLRWFQFATFSPLTRVHGEKSPREPWNWDDETVSVYKYFAWLKMNLQPYLIDVAHTSHQTGEPMMRPVALVYSTDNQALAVSDEYLFGPDLLVAPIHAAGTSRDVYLPAGTWYDLFANFKAVPGGRHLQQSATLAQMPLFARAGGILPLKLNSAWQLGTSMTSGSEPVDLLLPDPSGASSVAHDLTMVRDGRDLLITAGVDRMFALWIPSPTTHSARLGNHPLDAAAALPAPGPLPSCTYLDGRLCIRARILPGEPLRIVDYFAAK